MRKLGITNHDSLEFLFRPTAIDAALAFGLGLVSFICAVLDIHAYVAHRGKPPVTYAFNELSSGIPIASELELFRSHAGEYAFVENFTPLQRDGSHTYRYALGPTSTLTCVTQSSTALLNFQFINNIPNQGITVACDGIIIERLSNQRIGVISRSYSLSLHPGRNQITFTFSRYNHDGSLETADPRHIAGIFRAFELTLQ